MAVNASWKGRKRRREGFEKGLPKGDFVPCATLPCGVRVEYAQRYSTTLAAMMRDAEVSDGCTAGDYAGPLCFWRGARG